MMQQFALGNDPDTVDKPAAELREELGSERPGLTIRLLFLKPHGPERLTFRAVSMPVQQLDPDVSRRVSAVDLSVDPARLAEQTRSGHPGAELDLCPPAGHAASPRRQLPGTGEVISRQALLSLRQRPVQLTGVITDHPSGRELGSGGRYPSPAGPGPFHRPADAVAPGSSSAGRRGWLGASGVYS